MRLTPEQVQAIRHAAQRVLGNDAQVRVFGSMAIDNLKGGDIDLLFETDASLANRAQVLCQLHGALTLALGDRKIDVILKADAALFLQALSTARDAAEMLFSAVARIEAEAAAIGLLNHNPT